MCSSDLEIMDRLGPAVSPLSLESLSASSPPAPRELPGKQRLVRNGELEKIINVCTVFTVF